MRLFLNERNRFNANQGAGKSSASAAQGPAPQAFAQGLHRHLRTTGGVRPDPVPDLWRRYTPSEPRRHLVAGKRPESDPTHRHRDHAAAGLAGSLRHLHRIGEGSQRIPRQTLRSPWEGPRFFQSETARDPQENRNCHRPSWMGGDRGYRLLWLLGEQRRWSQLLSRYENRTDLSGVCILVGLQRFFAVDEEKGIIEARPSEHLKSGHRTRRRSHYSKHYISRRRKARRGSNWRN